MRSSTALDIVWTMLAGGIAVGGIVLCARQQGSAHSPGLRLAIILAAVALGIAGGLFTERLTRSRRKRKHRSPARHSRRRNRKIAFMVSGVVIAVCILALYIAQRTWLIVSAAIIVLAGNWIWYALEARGLTRGIKPRSSHHDSDGYRKRRWE